MVDWIEADMTEPVVAADVVEKRLPAELDVVIYNLGIWEESAFSEDYDYLRSCDEEIVNLVHVNITSAMLLLKRCIPRLLGSARPQVVLTGSTSGLSRSGQPEVAFGASKFALRGMADALREGFREKRLAVTCLQLGDLDTDESMSACSGTTRRSESRHLVPMRDVVSMTRALLDLSDSSFVQEIVLPAIMDERF